MGTWASVVVVCGLSCLMTCEIFLDQVDPRFPALVGVFFTPGTPVEWNPYILALGNWRSSLLIAPKVSRTSETFCDLLFYLVFVSRTTGSYKLQWYLLLFSVASKLCHRAHEHTEAAQNQFPGLPPDKENIEHTVPYLFQSRRRNLDIQDSSQFHYSPWVEEYHK